MNEIKLTEKDLKILEVLINNKYALSPTEIGLKLDQSYNQASSYCSNSLKKLMAAGKIIKITTGGVRYKLKQTK